MSRVMGTGPKDAAVVIIGEAPGVEEERAGTPFVGASGKELNRMLEQVGIARSECYITNVFKTRPPGNDLERLMPSKKGEAQKMGCELVEGRYLTPTAQEELTTFHEELSSLSPKVVITLGNASTWAVTGNWGIKSWRGSLLTSRHTSCRVIPTYHPAAILRQWSWRAMALADLNRAALEARDAGPVEPEWDFLVRPSYGQALVALRRMVKRADGAGLDQRGATIGPGHYYPPAPPESTAHGTTRRARPYHLSVDLETRLNHIACIGIADSPSSAICLPFMCVEDEEGYFTEEQEIHLIKLIKHLLTHPNVCLSGQNYLYDAQYTAKYWGFVGPVAIDTMIGHHTLYTGDIPKGLDTLSSLYCDYHQYWKDEGKHWDPAKHDEDSYWRYNCLDACRTWEIAEELAAKIARQDMREPFERQMWQFRPVLRMMLRGVRVDRARKNELSMECWEGLAQRQEWLNRILGKELNIRSSPQMKETFYDDLQCKMVKKQGRPTTDDKALSTIAKREPVLAPVCYTIQEMRTLNTLMSNVINRPVDGDGRWRSSFNIAGTETLRWSSSQNAFGSGLNLQNITKGEKTKGGGRFKLPNLRELFIPDYGKEVADVDLDRADVQVVAWDSGDLALKEKLQSGMDLHMLNAVDIFGGEYNHAMTAYKDKKHPEHSQWSLRRNFAKGFAHATNYGSSPRGLAMNFGQKVAEMEAAQNRWFAAHPGILEWHERVQEDLQTKKMVTNAFGYRRIYFDRTEGLLPEALAWIPQSTVANVINIALCRMDERYFHLLLPLIQVHDSLVFEYDAGERDRALACARECLEVTVPYDDPLTIPVGFEVSRNSWGAVEGVTA